MSSFKDGYDAFIRLSNANLAAEAGSQYVGRVEVAIDELAKAINSPNRKIDNMDIHKLKGFAAEWWHERSFNVDAALKDVKIRAYAPDDNGIVDVTLSSGEKFQMKYYKAASKNSGSAVQQSKTIFERYKEYANKKVNKGQIPDSFEKYCAERGLDSSKPNDPYYMGQGRIIPTEQLEEAKKWLKDKILTESNGGRPEQVKRYQETLEMLSDRIKSSEGAESIPLTEEESRKLAWLAKEAGFDPAKWGLSTEELIGFEYIMREAFKAGLSAALVTMVLQLAPVICGVICKLIETGEINAEDFKRLGFAALKGGAEGFVRGTIAAAVTTACKAGLLGTALKAAEPSAIGAVVAITLNSIENATLMAFGRISKHEFANRCVQDLIVTACSIGGGAAVAAAAATLFTPAAAVFGYMIGSFVGSVVGSFVYKGIYSCVISYCIESGSTFFGLVEQNYELPENVLNEIGIKVFEYEKFRPHEFNPPTFKPHEFNPKLFKPIEINITILKRGVIEVGSIGYI